MAPETVIPETETPETQTPEISLPRPAAVIFDLYGTLIDIGPDEAYRDLAVMLAETLGLPPEEFDRQFRHETYHDRSSGTFANIEENLRHICQRLGVDVPEEKIAAAANERIAFQRRALTPRPDAISTLTALRERGLKIGLISDCAPDVPLLWPELPFAPLIEVAVFSCVAGCMKPDPRLYAEVVAGLGVAPARCYYVGDNIHELDGATRAGMTPFRILTPTQAHLYRDRDAWSGRHLRALSDLLALIP